jgi:hypothetical protein
MTNTLKGDDWIFNSGKKYIKTGELAVEKVQW